MKSLYQAEAVNEVIGRINTLEPTSQRQWGKMEVAQMLAHCSAALEVAAGHKFPPRMFIGRIIGLFLKPAFSNDQPFNKNVPTDKSYIVADNRDFLQEKERLIDLIKQFSQGGPMKCTTQPHSFFGRLTPEEWSKGMYKHLDHHLKQFQA